MTSGEVGALPSATATLRNQRSKPMRRIALPGSSQKLRLAPSEYLDERRAVETVPYLEVLLYAGAGEFVPRTHELAIVAAVDAVADGVAQLERNRARKLDGEIGDAAPRIQSIGRDDGARGAGRQARTAGSAVRCARLIHRQREAQIDLADEEIRSGSAIDEVGVLADPPEPGVARERFLEDGRAVDECAIAERATRSAMRLQSRCRRWRINL